MDENEVICPCTGVSVGDIKAAVENGATTVEEVQEVTGAGTCCGRCLDEIGELVKKISA